MSLEPLVLTKAQKKKYYHLPIEQAVYVPTTTNTNHKVSSEVVAQRVNKVRHDLSNWFGGFTSVRATGGYRTRTKKGFVKEGVVRVVSFSTKKDYREHKKNLFHAMPMWGRSWGQETVGYEYETDMYYIPSAKKARKRR